MSDVAIVGGGIVGLACARELARRGARLTLLEYGKTGMQATNAAAGMLAPIVEAEAPGPMLEFGMRALRGFPALARELEAEAGFSVELALGGILKVALTEDDVSELLRRAVWQREMSLGSEWLAGPTCRELEPRLSEHVAGGLYSAQEGAVSNQLLALALERSAMAAGAEIRQHTPVIGFRREGSRVTAVRTPEGDVACDTVIIAAGARSGQIAARIRGAELPVHPVRGQMLALGGMHAPIRTVVWGPEGYLVPRANGLVFAGATVEHVGFRRRTTLAAMRRLRAMAGRLVPQLAAAQVQFEWAGLRPGTPDDMPIIGPLPSHANVIAATGHYRNGILLGPLTGAAVAAGIMDGDWSGVPDAFSPARFDAASGD
ncbi:MAG: glycine oxidase ThiO [Chloroflexi bacterium]|nr:glycine oxidase ThiO [Chloroflexota bacterium]